MAGPRTSSGTAVTRPAGDHRVPIACAQSQSIASPTCDVSISYNRAPPFALRPAFVASYWSPQTKQCTAGRHGAGRSPDWMRTTQAQRSTLLSAGNHKTFLLRRSLL